MLNFSVPKKSVQISSKDLPAAKHNGLVLPPLEGLACQSGLYSGYSWTGF